ncbi:MAG TPA: GNAT family N-acetyltransferase [Niabella sp.]|nr:GNAT family N-acetyltransferase [Niabella sp.]HOZ97499.1 GNAT family N-acetyltransferase [Niabella sp.]HQW15587.1 GNAT family N-acetyltransferase [Niabella sp.]HQX20730.1 GNAT family N-acetyltransferase [Niabella sp.]HQX40916.1 GNAT family N-acetyltransferase [Niabella sp.]
MTIPNNTLSYRSIGLTDAKAIYDLAAKIWPEAFAQILTDQQIEYMMKMMYALPVLEKEIERGVLYFIFYHKGKAVGYTAIEPKENNHFKLHKIYLSPSLQGKGIGRFLLEEMEKKAKTLGAEKLFLNVNRFNKAIHFYQRHGYNILREEDIDIGNGYFMNDYVMQKNL